MLATYGADGRIAFLALDGMTGRRFVGWLAAPCQVLALVWPVAAAGEDAVRLGIHVPTPGKTHKAYYLWLLQCNVDAIGVVASGLLMQPRRASCKLCQHE
jgi:hypothetical protein